MVKGGQVANDFNASLIISTSEAVNNVRNLDGATKDLDKTLAHLHSTMTANQGDVDKMAQALKDFTVAQSQSNTNQKTRNQNLIAEAKLEREGIVNKEKLAEGTRKQAQHEAKLEGIRRRSGQTSASALGNETRRNAESADRIANAGILTMQRANTENARYEAQQHRVGAALATRSAAEDRAQLTTLRLQQAQERARNSSLALNDSLSNSRYLLYDVAQTYTVISAALLALPVATTAVATAYEKDFAQVIRTTGIAKEDSHGLYNELTQLGREIPLTFSQFSEISSIAGQLGIAKDEVGAFTETVAKFGAASNVGISEAATAFGRLENSFNQDGNIPDFYNKVGSAIAKVGVESAASETEIIAVANQISAAGSQFGFAADEIVGMSGALASVRIRPELARGAFQRIMLNLSRAADEGGDSFEKFAKYTGVAGDAAIDLFKNDPSTFFNKYITGIKGTIDSGTSVSAVLDDIGAKNVFDKQFILGLANGLGVYNKALKDSSTAFDEGTFLNESTKITMETFAATLTKIGTAVQSLAARLAGGSLEPLTAMANHVLNIVSSFERLIQQQPAIGVVINGLLAFGGVVGVFLAFKAAQAFVLAGLVGLQQVMGKTAIAGALSLKGNMTELARTMLMSRGASAQLATQLLGTRTGMAALGFATQQTTASVQRFQTAGTLAGHAAGVAAGGATRGATAMKLFSGALGLVGGPIGAVITGLTLIGFGFISAAEEAKQAGDTIARAMKNGADAANNAGGDALLNRKVGMQDGASAFSDMGKNAAEIARQAGVAFDKVIAGAAGGEQGMKQFRAELERVAKADGYKSLEEAINNPLPGTTAANLQFLNKAVTEINGSTAEAKKNQDDMAAATDKLGGSANTAAPSAEGLSEGISGVSDEAEDAATAIKNMVDAIFGIVNAEAATQESLSKLGESLYKSTSLSTADDGGRDNLANVQDAFRNAALEQQQLVDSNKQSMQQASANYIQFIDGLLANMASKGVDVSQIQAMANQAKGIFGTTFASGVQPTITPKIDTSQVQAETMNATTAAQTFLSQVTPTLTIGANTSPADEAVLTLASNLSEITGWPFNVVVDALTNPATEKGVELHNLLTSITNNTYTAPVGADTSAAVTNIRNFATYAQQQLQAVQSAYNQVAASAPTLAKYTKSMFPGVKGVTSSVPAAIRAPSNASVSQVAAPKQVAPTIATPNFPGLDNGYNKAAKAAEKAGDAGKKAGKDMADGIDDATEAANDYANRLKTALTSAFDQQYGMQKATDEYHSALNAIVKKREEDLASIDELISKQKELNNSREEDLVSARKAGTEKEISQKYGEVDRAADYAQQEEEALLAAAAKQKDIEANNKTVVSLKAGISNFDGYSEAAIENREALRNLESKMLDMVVAYAATGASQEQVREYSKKLSAQFQTDAGNAYASRVQIVNLTGDMGRYATAVNSVPASKPTRIDAAVGGALGAVDTFNRAADWAARDRTADIYTNYHGSLEATGNVTANNQPTYRVIRPDGTRTNNILFNRGGEVPGFAGGGEIPGRSPSNPGVDNRFAQVDGKGMIKVRSGEFIVQQPAVDYWGLDFFKTLNNMKMPAFNAGGSIGGGRSSASGGADAVLVELTADNLAAILRLADRPIDLFAGVEKLASTVNEGNRILASKGVK
jgi:TP901 family phage tail tape measure protein